MKILIAICVFFIMQDTLFAQSLSSFNLSFQYNPDTPIKFKYRCSQKDTSIQIFFQITFAKNESIMDYNVSTFFKKNYENIDVIETNPLFLDTINTLYPYQGVYSCGQHSINSILIFEFDNIKNGKSYFFDVPLLQDSTSHPSSLSLYSSQKTPIYSHFVSTKDTLIIESPKKIIAYYLKKDFPQSSPPGENFEDTTHVSFDSSFVIRPFFPFILKKQGLYVLQEENNLFNAISIRAEAFYYPRYVKIEEIVKPMRYILTDEEYKKILSHKKKILDNVILHITNSVEKSKDLMQKYFRKISSANSFFTSYKEGWKTDRGCIYTIFGKPDVVEKFSHGEIWTYIRGGNNEELKFHFQKKTIFHFQEYLLQRNEKYQVDWYNVIENFRLKQDK